MELGCGEVLAVGGIWGIWWAENKRRSWVFDLGIEWQVLLYYATDLLEGRMNWIEIDGGREWWSCSCWGEFREFDLGEEEQEVEDRA